jgi:hypothetical protein
MTTDDREKFITLQVDVQNIKEDVKETKETVNKFNDDFRKLTYNLFGDVDTNSKGLIEDFRSVKIRLSRVEKFYVLVAGLVGIVISLITLWIKKLI